MIKELRAEAITRTMPNGNSAWGYEIGSPNFVGREYALAEKDSRGYIEVYLLKSLTDKRTFMGTRSSEEAERKLREITNKRLIELSELLRMPVARIIG